MMIKWDYVQLHLAEGSTQTSMNGSLKQTENFQLSPIPILPACQNMVLAIQQSFPPILFLVLTHSDNISWAHTMSLE